MKKLILFLLPLGLFAQNVQRFSATTGAVTQSGAASTSAIQQPATGASQVVVEAITVYCSAACSGSFAVNGTAATTTAGTVVPLLPTPLATASPFNFFTAANNLSGTTQQGGIFYLAAGQQQTFCFSTSLICPGTYPGGSPIVFVLGAGQGTATNLATIVNSFTGTSNTTYYVRTQ